MKKTVACLIAVGIILTGTYLLRPRWVPPDQAPGLRSIDELEWKEYTAADGTYGVLMPGSPVVRDKTVSNQFGNKTVVKLCELEEQRIPALFFAFHHGATVDEQHTAAALDSVCRETVLNHKGKLLSTKPINLRGYPGREMVMEKPDLKGTSFQACRFYLANNRFYCIAVVVNSQDQVSATYVTKYLDSFRLKEQG